ncbi:MAG: hypothetical protein VKK04_05300 [Synechococcales bacterium]|nr:hypothetical protein [Synechococcales bacterium]
MKASSERRTPASPSEMTGVVLDTAIVVAYSVSLLVLLPGLILVSWVARTVTARLADTSADSDRPMAMDAGFNW